jgi:hypothetical protein
MSRIDKLKQQHPELNVTIIDLMAKVDPTGSYKYTEFLIKKIKDWYGGETTDETLLTIGIELLGEENVSYLNEFEAHCKAGRVKNNDIGQHKDFTTIKSSVKEAEEIIKQKEAEKQVVKLMDTAEYCVVIPLSYEASKIYGANTKWCTTQEKYWNDYYKNYKLIYIIDKVKNQKYAISRKKDNPLKIQAWLSNDDESNPLLLPISSEVISLVSAEVQKDESVFDLIKPDNEPKLKADYDTEMTTQEMLDYMRRYINGDAGGFNSIFGGGSFYSNYYNTWRDTVNTYRNEDDNEL